MQKSNNATNITALTEAFFTYNRLAKDLDLFGILDYSGHKKMLKFWLSRSDETGQAYHEISFPKDSNLTNGSLRRKTSPNPSPISWVTASVNLESWHKGLGRKVGTFPKLKINLHPTSTYHVRLRFMNIIFFRLFGIDWFGPGSLGISLANLTADDFLETHPWYFQGEKRQQNTFLSPQNPKVVVWCKFIYDEFGWPQLQKWFVNGR